MAKEIKWFREIRNLAVAALIFLILFAIINLMPYIIPENIMWNLWDAFFWGFLAIVLVLEVACIVVSIIIICRNWKTQWIKKNKVLGGLLSLLLSFIGLIIFSSIAIKHAEQDVEYSNIPIPPQDQYKNPSHSYNLDSYDDKFDDNY